MQCDTHVESHSQSNEQRQQRSLVEDQYLQAFCIVFFSLLISF